MTRETLKDTPPQEASAEEEVSPEVMTRPTTEATTGPKRRPLLLSDLGWSKEETIDTYFRLRPFQEDRDAPGMDAYDDL